MKRWRIAVSFLVLCASTTLHAATEVIPLSYRPAADVLPVVQSILGNQGKVEAYGNQLIVNTTPAKLAEIRTVLQQIDSQPRQLLITLDTQNEGNLGERGYAVGGGSIQPERSGVTVIRRSTEDRGSGIQQVQVTEGYPAMIQVGQSVPLTSIGTDRYGQIYQDTQYRDVTRGLYVTASVTGDTVHLRLSTHHDQLSRHSSQTVDTQTAETRLTGKLGQWISVGGQSNSRRTDHQALLRRYSTDGQRDFALRVKVDALD